MSFHENVQANRQFDNLTKYLCCIDRQSNVAVFFLIFQKSEEFNFIEMELFYGFNFLFHSFCLDLNQPFVHHKTEK